MGRHMPAWLRRTCSYVVVLWVAVTVNFLLPRLAPGDPALQLWTGAGQPTERELDYLRETHGLEGSVLQQYVDFWAAMTRGDLGHSISENRPVTEALLERVPWTLALVALGLTGAVVLGTLIGAWSAWRRHRGRHASDRATMVLALAVDSMPGFWTAMILMAVFSAQLGWFPTYAMAPMPDPGLDFLAEAARRLALPVTTMVLATFGAYYLLARGSMMSVLDEPFVRMARAKGLSDTRVAVGHALRTALLPVATNAATAAGAVVSGAVVVETVFSYPGLGLLIADAVAERDYPLLQGAFLFATIAVILANVLSDLIYPLIDPRVRSGAEVVVA